MSREVTRGEHTVCWAYEESVYELLSIKKPIKVLAAIRLEVVTLSSDIQLPTLLPRSESSLEVPIL